MKFTTVNLLDELAKPEFSSLLSAFHARFYPRQNIIFAPSYEDEAEYTGAARVDTHAESSEAAHAKGVLASGNYVFIVRNGLVRVYLSYGDKEFTIAFLRPGDVYVSHSSAMVQAVEDTTILLVDTPTFNRRMMSVPQFTVTVVRVLGGILKNTFNIVDGLALRDVSARLARYLLSAAQESAPGPDGRRRAQLQVSGEMLAQTLGASRQTISTLLTDLTRSGILRKEQRGLYCIMDEARLREMLE
jgi:CRP/FNR family transcriptional regulator, carbon monoxide oxidation system transcription regulator